MTGRRLCAHADLDGEGMHFLEPGESCPRTDPVPVVAQAELATAMISYWSGRLDGFCAELESKGFRIVRDGLSVRIYPPELTP